MEKDREQEHYDFGMAFGIQHSAIIGNSQSVDFIYFKKSKRRRKIT